MYKKYAEFQLDWTINCGRIGLTAFKIVDLKKTRVKLKAHNFHSLVNLKLRPDFSHCLNLILQLHTFFRVLFIDNMKALHKLQGPPWSQFCNFFIFLVNAPVFVPSSFGL